MRLRFASESAIVSTFAPIARVMIFTANPVFNSSGMSKTVHVSNISHLIEKSHIEDLFGAIGTVVSCSLSPPDASGTRTAVVEFNDPALAQAALYLNDTPLGDKSLAIRLADSADSHSSHEPSGNIEAFNPFANMLRSAAQAPVLPMGGVFGGSIDISNALSEAARKRADEVARTIYVGNLDGAITEEHLKMVFQVAGEILYIKIAGDVNNPQSGRYGFIEFSKLESVPVAMQLSGTVLANRPLKVGHANVRTNPAFALISKYLWNYYFSFTWISPGFHVPKLQIHITVSKFFIILFRIQSSRPVQFMLPVLIQSNFLTVFSQLCFHPIFSLEYCS
jgi:arginine/serine-rich splicing factor 12